jgi:hypothetical protein
MPELTSQQALIHVTVIGSSLDKEPWTTMDGGDISVTALKTRDGGGGEERNLGGVRVRSDCTVGRQYTNDVIHPLIAELERLCGSAEMKVSWTPVDADQNPNGVTWTIQGKLDDVKKPKWDAITPDVAMVELVMGCHSTPAVQS